MITYQEVLSDPLIIKIYSNVDKVRVNNWAGHGLTHIAKSINNMKKIAQVCGLEDKQMLENALIACALHDVGMIAGKPQHAKRSFKFAKAYLKNKVDKKSKRQIISAIKNHSQIRPSAPLCEKLLVLADKLDMDHLRILPGGKGIPGMRQVESISKIDILVTNQTLVVEFFITKTFNQTEWDNYYFTTKMQLATANFCHCFKLNWEFKYTNI